jgi:hypothetical protein
LQDALDSDPGEEKDDNSLVTTDDPHFGQATGSPLSFLWSFSNR